MADEQGQSTVAAIRPGDSVRETFLLAELQQRAKKNGDPFFFLTLRDASGTIQGVMWDNHDSLVAGTIGTDDFVEVEGHAAEYNGATQLTVKNVSRVDDATVDVSRFLPVSPRPVDEMEAELDALVESVTQPDCRRLLDRMFGHQKLRQLYCEAPAAARIHQAYRAGLLEHTLNVISNALKLGEKYQPFDRDLLVTAGLLHDLGKIREYDWRRSISYTDDGRLQGHIFMGASMVDSAIKELARTDEGFSTHYHRHILHIILSHHGKLEYGSPVIPKTREAWLLHHGDYIDAYMAAFIEATDEAQGRGESWTAYNKLFQSYLYAGEPVAGSPGTGTPPPPAQPDPDPREGFDAPESMDDPGR